MASQGPLQDRTPRCRAGRREQHFRGSQQAYAKKMERCDKLQRILLNSMMIFLRSESVQVVGCDGLVTQIKKARQDQRRTKLHLQLVGKRPFQGTHFLRAHFFFYFNFLF